MSAPICPACNMVTRLTTGAEIYPLRPDLAGKQIYTCDGCGARVGCHPGTTTALGIPAGKELRIARLKLHASRIDPIWQNAWRHPAYADAQAHPNGGRRSNGRAAREHRKVILRTARNRVYAYLAHHLGISIHDCHTGMFDLERCRAAWRALTGVTYADVRAWAKAQEAEREVAA